MITTTLENMMGSHPGVYPRSHEAYDLHVVESADDDLIKVVLALPSFPFSKDLHTSTCLRTFEEILSSTGDEDEDYR